MDKKILRPEEAKHSEPNKAFDNLARILRKNFGNPDWNGPFLGKVVKAPPNLEVQIDERIILKADRIVVAFEKVAGYTREFEVEGNIEIDVTDRENMDSGGNTHNKITAKGTDELKVGDEVILNEFKNQKKFYLVDKAYYYNKAGG